MLRLSNATRAAGTFQNMVRTESNFNISYATLNLRLMSTIDSDNFSGP